jgi:ABC-type multidrug transport system fused ATPase/permease subunit
MAQEVTNLLIFIFLTTIVFAGGFYFISSSATTYGKTAQSDQMSGLMRANQTYGIMNQTASSMQQAISTGSPLDYFSAAVSAISGTVFALFAVPIQFQSIVVTALSLIGLEAGVASTISSVLYYLVVSLIIIGLYAAFRGWPVL